MDDDQLRKLAAGRPGYATYPDSRPGSPSWWTRRGHQPPARPTPTSQPWAGPDPLMAFGPPMILAPLDDDPADQFADEFAPTLAEQLQEPKVRAAYEAEAAEQLVERHGEPMREALFRARSRNADHRRWWHRWSWR